MPLASTTGHRSLSDGDDQSSASSSPMALHSVDPIEKSLFPADRIHDIVGTRNSLNHQATVINRGRLGTSQHDEHGTNSVFCSASRVGRFLFILDSVASHPWTGPEDHGAALEAHCLKILHVSINTTDDTMVNSFTIKLEQLMAMQLQSI